MNVSINAIKKQIDDFFGDTSQSRDETAAALEELRDEIEWKLATLK